MTMFQSSILHLIYVIIENVWNGSQLDIKYLPFP